MPLLYDTARLLDNLGVITVVLPFMLSFTIIYALLQQYEVLSKKKNINAIVATVVGLLVVASFQMIEALSTIIVWGSIIVVVGLLLFMIFGMTGIKIEKQKWYWHLAWVIAFLLMGILGLSLLGLQDWARQFFTSPLWWTIVVAALLALAVWFIVSGKEKPGRRQGQQTRMPQNRVLQQAQEEESE